MLPILFTLPTPWGPQPIYAYGVLLGLSLIAGYQITVRVAARFDALDEDLTGNAYLLAAVCGLAGARALYVLENREALEIASASWFDITSGGVTAYGGFFGGLIGTGLFLRYKRASLAAFADAAAPALAAGVVLTRIGCYLYGCDFGIRLSDSAPGFLAALGTFPRWDHEELEIFGAPAYLHHLGAYGLDRKAMASFPVHPTQLYEAVAGLLLLGVTAAVLRKRRFHGQAILVLAMGYGALRFLFEYLRDDPERAFPFGLGFSSAQLISLLLVPACAFTYTVRRGRAFRA
jgi:phosphatidylglycerol---prolipoprotein diacylglyceryl transferase